MPTQPHTDAGFSAALTSQQSPFLNDRATPAVIATPGQATNGHAAPAVPARTRAGTPFLSVYEVNGQAEHVDPEAEEYVSLLSELHDEAFDEAVFELVNEAAALYEERFAYEGGAAGAATEAERFLEEHFSPLIREAEAMLDNMAGAGRDIDLSGFEENEIESLMAPFSPRPEGLTPNFDFFLGGLFKKAKKIAKKAVRLAKRGVKAAAKLGLGPILNKLKALVRPLLKRVLKSAINRLPRWARPHARRLTQRLPFLKEVEAETDAGNDATLDLGEIQRELDLQVSELLFAEDEVEQEVALAAFAREAQEPAYEPGLDRARLQFAGELVELEDGEDPAPAVERFIPAVLPALKLGIRLAGRKRVVNFLARLVARLIRRFVGRRAATSLSRALVDSGLRLIRLEATPEDEAEAAGSAVAATVEDTLRQVAALPEHVLDNEALLEGFVLEAFERAAASNLPPVLRPEVYEQRPDLRETTGPGGAWVWQPLRGAKRYKKYTRVYDTVITPYVAQAVKTYGGRPLAAFLQDRLGFNPGRALKARVHLYEAMPGTLLPQISRYEQHVPGMNASNRNAGETLHPLMPEAAGILLNQPGLGRPAAPQYLASARQAEVGQRFFYLEIPDAPAQIMPGPGGASTQRRSSDVHLTFDFPGYQLRAALFLSEADAQALAAKLRAQGSIGSVVAHLQALIEPGLQRALSSAAYGHVYVVHDAVRPDAADGAALKRIAPIVLERLADRISLWLSQGLSTFFQQQAHAFSAAAEAPDYGVTLNVTLTDVPGFALLRDALKGKAVVLRDGVFTEGMPTLNINVNPGYHRD